MRKLTKLRSNVVTEDSVSVEASVIDLPASDVCKQGLRCEAVSAVPDASMLTTLLREVAGSCSLGTSMTTLGSSDTGDRVVHVGTGFST